MCSRLPRAYVLDPESAPLFDCVHNAGYESARQCFYGLAMTAYVEMTRTFVNWADIVIAQEFGLGTMFTIGMATALAKPVVFSLPHWEPGTVDSLPRLFGATALGFTVGMEELKECLEIYLPLASPLALPNLEMSDRIALIQSKFGPHHIGAKS